MDRDRIIRKLQGSSVVVGGATYKLVRELGRGGNGAAFLCSRTGGEQVVAKIYIPADNRDLDDRALDRFRNEVAITSKIKHAYVVPSLGAATVAVGAYHLPSYLMPVATGTLRAEMQPGNDPEVIERKLRLLLRAAYGTACLHHHGIVHRDLKPENILINKSGNPWIADLGIAHVAPDFVSVGLKTIASERLLNRDYYAPEQRFGAATEVDHRVDIYALGCIFYELLTSIPPVRAHAPDLSVVSSAFKPFDGIWKRMTEWEAARRYQTMEDVMEDLSIAIGVVLATLRGTAGLRNPDLSTMLKLLRANNDLQKQQGIELAIRLGKAALPDLHDLMGHNRRDVRNAVAKALGQIGDESSIPVLVAGLYGSSEKASSFRPSCDAAAIALAQYPEPDRLRAMSMVERPIRPSQVVTVLKGTLGGYDAATRLHERSMLLLDWVETELGVLLQLDEERAWPLAREYLAQAEDYRKRNLIPHLKGDRRREVIRDWLKKGTEYRWYLTELLGLILNSGFEEAEIETMLTTLEHNVNGAVLKLDERGKLLERVRLVRERRMLPLDTDDGLTQA